MRHFHDGVDGWITGETDWIQSGPGMNGVSPWPPAANATTFVVRAADWPDVHWPMNVTTNGTVDPDQDTGCGVRCSPLDRVDRPTLKPRVNAATCGI